MSDYIGNLQKVRQATMFDMRHSYDENKTADKQKMGEFSYYNKEQVLEENATIESLLNLQSTDQMTEQLPELTRQEIQERLFTNKAYLLINEHSKTDSPYMEAVKTSVTNLTESLFAPMEAGKIGETLNKISTLYQTALDKCKDYLERGTGKRKVPFWPWHKQRYDAVDEMEQNLVKEKEKFEFNKQIVMARLDEEDLGMQPQAPTDFEVRKSQIDKGSLYRDGELMIKSAMDVVLIDRFDVDKQTERFQYVEKEAEELNDELYKELEKVEVSKQDAMLTNALDLMKQNEVTIVKYTDKELDVIMEGTTYANKILESDVGATLKVINDIKEKKGFGLDPATIDENIKLLEEVVKPAKKNKKTLDISPEIHHMAGVLLDQLKTLKNNPFKFISKLSNKELRTQFGMSIDFGIFMNTSFSDRDTVIKDEIKRSPVSNTDFIDALMRIYGGSVFETYKKYVLKTNLYKTAAKINEMKLDIDGQLISKNIRDNFVS